MTLGGLGLTPGLGEPADAIDWLISLGKGDYIGALLSGVSMIIFMVVNFFLLTFTCGARIHLIHKSR